MDFFQWLEVGKEKNWVSDIVCNTHEGPDMTEEEYVELSEGDDPCVFVVRVWTDLIQKEINAEESGEWR